MFVLTSTSASLLHSGVLVSCNNCDEALVELLASDCGLLVFSLETVEDTVDDEIGVDKEEEEKDKDDDDDDLNGDVKETGL